MLTPKDFGYTDGHIAHSYKSLPRIRYRLLNCNRKIVLFERGPLHCGWVVLLIDENDETCELIYTDNGMYQDALDFFLKVSYHHPSNPELKCKREELTRG